MFLIFYMKLQLHDFFLKSQQSLKLPEKFFFGGGEGEGGKVDLVLGFSDQNYLS